MKTAKLVNLVLLILLSIATGIFKLTQQPEDIELFEAIGFNVAATTALGAIQLIGGILVIIPKTRKWGALIMAITFIIASIAVFANKQYLFGVVSLIFIAMAIVVWWNERTPANS